jgi:hypothetical protein
MTAGVLLALCVLAGPPADTAAEFRVNSFATPRKNGKNWPHDVGHVATLAVITPAIYGFSLETGSSRRQARLIAAGTAVAAMVLKEWHDHRAVGNFSGRDIAFGVLGTGAGFYIAERINWSPGQRTEKNQR